MSITVDALVRSGLGDCRITGIAWGHECDLAIRIRLPDARQFEIAFEWVTSLDIDMDFGPYAGRPLVYEVLLETRENGTKHCEFLFGAQPEGSIAFDFSQATVVELP